MRPNLVKTIIISNILTISNTISNILDLRLKLTPENTYSASPGLQA